MILHGLYIVWKVDPPPFDYKVLELILNKNRASLTCAECGYDTSDTLIEEVDRHDAGTFCFPRSSPEAMGIRLYTDVPILDSPTIITAIPVKAGGRL